MSMCCLRLINVQQQLYRRAIVLAGRFRSLPASANAQQKRDNHNKIFQMVKKRTLEARSKLQANTYPNNKPVFTNESVTTSASNPSPNVAKSPTSITNSKCISTSSRNPASSSSSSNNKDQNTTKNSSKSCNVEILKAPNCSWKPIPDDCKSPTVVSAKDQNRPMLTKSTGEDPCGPRPPAKRIDDSSKDVVSGTGKGSVGVGRDGAGAGVGAGGGGGTGGPGSALSNQMKLLLALAAAALGLGGLLWFLTRKRPSTSKKEGVEESCDSSASTSDTGVLKSSDLPKHVPYLLIGGGTASFSAFRAIKTNDARARVLIITDEQRKPYMRPPLSKELWYSAQSSPELVKNYRFKQWTGAERSLFFEPEEFFIHPSKLCTSPNGGVAVAHGFTVKKIDPAKRLVTLSDGYEIGYDECLIATGCKPKSLPIFLDAPPPIREKVMVYRTPDDFEKLKRYVDANKNVTIVGNGFIGSELACSLANYRKCDGRSDGGRIYQIFPEAGNMSKVLPDYLSRWTMRKVESQGVRVLPHSSIVDVKRDNSSLKLTLSTGDTLMSDVVCVCIGCEANTDLAKLSGLEVDRSLGGFVVNAELEARRNLYVAGDASCFYDPLLGRRRVEHHDHSIVSGRLAGENMVGKKKAYCHQSMFWSDLGPEIGYEGIGLVDASLPTVGVFALPNKIERKGDNLTDPASSPLEPPTCESVDKELEKKSHAPPVKCNEPPTEDYGRGVIFYLRDDKIVGILLWNLFSRTGLARTIINQNQKYDDLNEVAKLFEIHS